MWSLEDAETFMHGGPMRRWGRLVSWGAKASSSNLRRTRRLVLFMACRGWELEFALWRSGLHPEQYNRVGRRR